MRPAETPLPPDVYLRLARARRLLDAGDLQAHAWRSSRGLRVGPPEERFYGIEAIFKDGVGN